MKILTPEERRLINDKIISKKFNKNIIDLMIHDIRNARHLMKEWEKYPDKTIKDAREYFDERFYDKWEKFWVEEFKNLQKEYAKTCNDIEEIYEQDDDVFEILNTILER